MVVVARTYPPERFAFITAILIAIGGLGDLLSTAPLAYLAESLGWRKAFLVAASLTAGAALLCYRLIETDPAHPGHKPETLSHLFRGMAGIGAIRGLWPILPLSFFGYAVLME